jgi:DNA-binding response OmpR family regulator
MGTRHILVVDDDSSTRKLLAEPLQVAAHRVTTAASCGAAEAATHTYTFDVIVLDVMLPDGSGITGS